MLLACVVGACRMGTGTSVGSAPPLAGAHSPPPGSMASPYASAAMTSWRWSQASSSTSEWLPPGLGVGRPHLPRQPWPAGEVANHPRGDRLTAGGQHVALDSVAEPRPRGGVIRSGPAHTPRWPPDRYEAAPWAWAGTPEPTGCAPAADHQAEPMGDDAESPDPAWATEPAARRPGVRRLRERAVGQRSAAR